jgi:CubicO group peptidase (beta-lactamase class C family)
LGGLPAVTPEDAGFSSQRLMRLDAWLRDYVAQNKLSGASLAVIRHGKLVFAGKAGRADREKSTPIADDTLFRIFSMTKPVTSLALMMLFEEGRFGLDEPVAKYFPEFAQVKVYAGADTYGRPVLKEPRRAMTIRDLFTHMAGLSYGNSKHPVDEIYAKANIFDLRQSCPEFLKRLSELPLIADPGEKWNYSYAVDVQGCLVELLSGQRLDAFMRERIFEPLGMTDTFFTVPADKEDRFANIYRRATSGEGIEHAPYPPGREISYSQAVTFMSGGGGLVSTMGDYLRFAQMLLAGGELGGVRLLGPKTVELMMLDHVPADTGPKPGGVEGYGFGLGGAVLRDVAQSQLPGSLGEFTWAGAASTIFWLDKQEELCVVFMTQMVPSDTYPLRKQLKQLVYQALID